MINKLIALIIISVIVVFFPKYAEHVMSWILMMHAWILDFLGNIFSDGRVGRVIRDLLSLLAFPFIAGFIPAILYSLIRHRSFPYFMFIVWSAWLLQLGALIVLHKM